MVERMEYHCGITSIPIGPGPSPFSNIFGIAIISAHKSDLDRLHHPTFGGSGAPWWFLVVPGAPLCLRLGRLLDPPLPMITKRTGTVVGMAWAGHPKKVGKLLGKMKKNGWISKISILEIE